MKSRIPFLLNRPFQAHVALPKLAVLEPLIAMVGCGLAPPELGRGRHAGRSTTVRFAHRSSCANKPSAFGKNTRSPRKTERLKRAIEHSVELAFGH
jgi:hypothetical protein